MTNKDDYVSPPGSNNDYVPPPVRENNSDYVAPPSGNRGGDYVAPPKRNSGDEYVAPPGGNTEYIKPQISDTDFSNRKGAAQSTNNQKINVENSAEEGYFDTPKMGIRFYISGYLIWMFIIFVFMSSEALYIKILTSIYILFTNYTFCWYILYQNLKYGDNVNIVFRSTTALKASAGIASSMNHTTGRITKSWTGEYKVSSRTSIWDTFVTFILTYVFIELLKLIINIPLALYSAFRHKRNVRVCKELAR